MTLLERFELAAKAGLTGLTFWKTSKGWQVSSRFGGGWYISTSEDIEEAMLKALSAAKRVKSRKGLPDRYPTSPQKKARRKQRRLERKKWK